MMKKLKHLLYLLPILLISACSSLKKQSDFEDELKAIDLIGSHWIIDQKEDLNTKKITKPKGKYIISFDTSSIQMKLDVNTCIQKVKYSANNSLKLEPNINGCTKMCCDAKDAEEYINLFTNGMKYGTKDRLLFLYTENVRYTLIRKRESTYKDIREKDLYGLTWKATKVITLEKNVATKPSKPYIIAFEEGLISVKLSVNSCRKSCKFIDTKVEFPTTSMACTKMCCDTKEDLAYLDHFKGSFIIRMKSNGSLSLLNDQVELYFDPDF